MGDRQIIPRDNFRRVVIRPRAIHVAIANFIRILSVQERRGRFLPEVPDINPRFFRLPDHIRARQRMADDQRDESCYAQIFPQKNHRHADPRDDHARHQQAQRRHRLPSKTDAPDQQFDPLNA